MLLPPSALLFGALSFASSSLAQTLSLPSTPNGGSLGFFYQTQDFCSRASPGSILGLTTNGNGEPTCGCLDPGTGTECSKQSVVDAGQTICLVASTYNSGGSKLSRTAKCGSCSRRAGSPNARSIHCQDLFTLGETTTSGTCRQGEGLYVTSATSNYGICQCASSATAAGPGAKLCPRPKANGSEAFCRRIVEQFSDGKVIPYNGASMGCHMRCNSGFHESPAEKPVTCCKAGFRSNSAGVCSKSTDGKL